MTEEESQLNIKIDPKLLLALKLEANKYGKPLKEDKETKEMLKDVGMILDPNPIDEREAELKNICRSLGLTEDMPDMPKDKIKELYKKDSPYYGELPKDLIKKGV